MAQVFTKKGACCWYYAQITRNRSQKLVYVNILLNMIGIILDTFKLRQQNFFGPATCEPGTMSKSTQTKSLSKFSIHKCITLKSQHTIWDPSKSWKSKGGGVSLAWNCIQIPPNRSQIQYTISIQTGTFPKAENQNGEDMSLALCIQMCNFLSGRNIISKRRITVPISQ